MKKFMSRVKSFLEALLSDDDQLIMDVFGKNGELIPGAAPTVQKIFKEAHQEELVAAAKAYREKKQKKS